MAEPVAATRGAVDRMIIDDEQALAGQVDRDIVRARTIVLRLTGLVLRRERERGAFAGRRLDPDPAAHAFDEALDDRQAESRAATGADVLVVDAIETIEDPAELTLRYADAAIPHEDLECTAVARPCGHLHPNRVVRVFDRVVEQIRYGLKQ